MTMIMKGWHEKARLSCCTSTNMIRLAAGVHENFMGVVRLIEIECCLGLFWPINLSAFLLSVNLEYVEEKTKRKEKKLSSPISLEHS